MEQHTPSRARRRASGIRIRVVIGAVVLLATGLAIVALVTRQVLLASVAEDVDRELAQEVEELRRLAGGTDPSTGEPFGGDAAAIFSTFLSRNVPLSDEAFYTFVGGEPYLRSFDAPVDVWGDAGLVERWSALEAPAWAAVDTSAGAAETLAVPVLDERGETLGTFVVAIFPGDRRDDVARVVRVILLVGAGVLAVATAFAWSLAGRVLAPVREVTTTARRIGQRDLRARIPVEGHDELAELGRTFNDMLDRLEAAFASERAVLDDVAHELRTPLTIVRGHLELLSDDPEERRETIVLVTDELDRMGRYVSDLLVVAKAEQPDFLHPGPVDLGEMAAGLLARARAIAPRRWELVAAPAPGHAIVVADEARLTQAMVGLATNAAQHTGPGDTIGLGVAVDEEDVRLWVQDRGPGVDPDLRHRLFRRFSRGAHSQQHRPEGTGLGLAIVAAIARAHGGRVDVADADGGGAVFTITIPRDAGEEPT